MLLGCNNKNNKRLLQKSTLFPTKNKKLKLYKSLLNIVRITADRELCFTSIYIKFESPGYKPSQPETKSWSLNSTRSTADLGK